MRNLMVMAGLCSLMGFVVAACGSDVETQSGAASSSSTAGGNTGSGGFGGMSGAQTSSSSSSSTTGGGGMGSLCDQACNKLAVECGFGQVCDTPQVAAVLNCEDPASDCPGQCILDASCGAISSLLGGTPDPALVGCVQSCQGGQGGGMTGGCQNCLINSCLNELMNCSEMSCQGFLNCAMACPDGDTACYNGCAADPAFQGAQTTAIVDCGSMNCTSECGMIGGGAGGAGGS